MTQPSEPKPSGYQEIANQIEEKIVSGELQSGDKLQSERKMSSELGVNRLTVRRAFNLLEERGLVSRRHGGGTYVTSQRIERQAGELVPFTYTMLQMGMAHDMRVITFDQVAADEPIAQLLEIKVGAPIYDIYRVRLLNQEPVMLEQFFVSVERFPGFEKHDHIHLSGYQIMESVYGCKVEQATQSLEPVIATQYEADLLGITPGDPLMLETRLSYDQTGQPIEFGKDLYRGDRFRFVTSNARLTISWSA